MIRITSGSAKNTQLNTPEIKDFRAVQDIVKQAVFAIIADKVSDATCLDLFAGSGSMGLEALSRGAKRCDFVDEHREAEEAIFANVKKCHFEDKVEIFGKKAVKFAGHTANKYDLIFMDPFYEDTKQKFLFKLLERHLNPSGQLVFLHGDKVKVSDYLTNTGFETITERKFGAGMFTILKLK